MGEEAKELPKPETKPEEKPTEEETEKPKPPSPLILFVDLHCVGCAKKIEKSILRITGVEGVAIDMAQNQLTIKGIMEPEAVCDKIMKKTKRRAKVISPLLEADGASIPDVVVTSQVSGAPTVVELDVNMHCEACAEQLKRKILKMKGVQAAVTNLSTSKVTVTGKMDANKLVDYVYRRTKKQAWIVPQPEPEQEKQEDEEEEKPAEDAAKPEEKKEENAEKKEEEKPPEEGKKDEGDKETNNAESNESKEEGKKEGLENNVINIDDENMKRIMHYYQPLYVIERIPPPQLFSDENPNACCIT